MSGSHSDEGLTGFGDYLKALRESHARLTLGAAVLRLRTLGINTGKSTLSRYESGERVSPDPVILWGLSRIYGEPLDQIVSRLVAASTGRRAKPTEEPPSSRLGEEEIRERRMLQLFRAAPKLVQIEMVELLEFKSRRGNKSGGAEPQLGAAASRGRFSGRGSRRRPPTQ